MKKTLFILVVFGCAFRPDASAQVMNSSFQKLFDLYTMENYEKCAYKAESYSRKDKYRRDPEPYLYMALCFYQAHVQPDKFENEYKDPLKDALKYAYKFRKKDKQGDIYRANKELLDKIREEAISKARFYYNDGQFGKSASEFNRVLKVIPDDPNIMYITGAAMIKAKNAGQGEMLINQAMDSLRVYESENRFEKDAVTHDVLIKGIVGYTDYLSESNQLEKALEVITFSRSLIADEPRIKSQYAKLYAKAPEE